MFCADHMFGGPGAADPVSRARAAHATPVKSRGQECPRRTGRIIRANGCGARAGTESSFCAYPGLTSWAKVGRRCRGWSFGPIIRGTLRAVLIFRGRARPRHAGQRPRTGVSALHGEDCPVKRWGARAGPETHFCAYPGLTSWAIVGRPCRGWSLCRSHMFGGPGAGDPVWRARGARATPVRSRGQDCPRYTGKIVRANGCGARAGPEPFFLRLPRTYSWAIIRRPCRR